MKKLIIATLLLLLMAGPVFGASYDLTLQWDENTEPDLATGEKARYKIYVRTGESLADDKANATEVFEVKVADDENADPLLVQKTVVGFDDSTVKYIAVTALDEDGNESYLSNEVNTGDIDVTAPGRPVLRILKWLLKKYGD